MSTAPNFLDFTINLVLLPTFIQKFCHKLSSIVTFTIHTDFFYQNMPSLGYWMASELPRLLDTALKFALFSLSGLKDEKLIKKSKPTWKPKHANSILQSFKYICQISSKLILAILSYTVSKLVHFLRHSVHPSKTLRRVCFSSLFQLFNNCCEMLRLCYVSLAFFGK